MGISEGFSCMRTFCQSVNFELSICSCQAVRLPHVGFGHKLGWLFVRKRLQSSLVYIN